MSAYREVVPSLVARAGAGRRRTMIAAVIGNTLEWYDFVVYAFLAGTIAKLFFPAGNDTASLLLTLATFGVGFVMRPLGAVVLGSLADRAGRKPALLITIVLMGLGTAMIGFAPTYAAAGWVAPLVIVTARLIQGFSAGGELGSATSFMMENSPPDRRGLGASWQQASQAATLVVCSLVGVAVTGLIPVQDLEAWGWRVPFFIGRLSADRSAYARPQHRNVGCRAVQHGGADCGIHRTSAGRAWRTLSHQRAVDRNVAGLQRRGHDLRRICAVHCDMADR